MKRLVIRGINSITAPILIPSPKMPGIPSNTSFQKFYDKMEGISIPQPFCQSFVPFAIVINKLLDKIPGFDKLNIDSEGMKKKFGLMGEPLFLGIVIGCGISSRVASEIGFKPSMKRLVIRGINSITAPILIPAAWALH